MRALINCIGFIGDNIFASSIAERLREQGFDYIDYNLSIAQPLELLSLNPNIDRTFYQQPINHQEYDRIFNLEPIHRRLTPCEQFQLQCEIQTPTPYYKVYTNPSQDNYVTPLIGHVAGNRKIIAWMSNWEERTFGFTEEEYQRGIDVPNLGYGGRRRDIKSILQFLEQTGEYFLVEVGLPCGTDQRTVTVDGVSNYTLTASMIKACDWFIGGEGGLANLAAGVGTKTIITGDFVHQLYGWNGVIEKNLEPKLGPKYYFPQGHHTLDPYLTDLQTAQQIHRIICNS
jgi:hypothetical protein